MPDVDGEGTEWQASAPRGTSRAGSPRWICDSQSFALAPVPLRERTVQEDDLQVLLDRHPDLLPIDEIGAAWGPLVSLGRELGLTRGSIDNLFVSPAGDLTVVEAKLWRNPEARRKVVGQILDYAAELAMLSYEQLDRIVIDAAPDGLGIWDRVRAAHPGLDEAAEHRFIDVLARNLRAGRFLLLIAGDGIRTDLESIASLVRSHPSLAFHLELVELRLYRMPDDAGFLVVPEVVGRTVETVTRAVIQVTGPDGAQVGVTIEGPPSGTVEAGGRRFDTVDDFLAAFEDATDAGRARAVGELISWWRAERRGRVKLGKQSLNLSVPYPYRPGGGVSVMTIYVDGWAQGSVAPMVEWRELISRDEALPHFEDAGFVPTDPLWPRLDHLDLTDAASRRRLEALLVWADEFIRCAGDELVAERAAGMA